MNDGNTKVVDEKVAEEEKQEIILINEETIFASISIFHIEQSQSGKEITDMHRRMCFDY